MSERDGRGVLGSILDDIRNKLVDEGWFGRRPTESREDPLGRWGGEADGSHELPVRADDFERAWAVKQPEPAMPTRDRDHGMDL